MKNIPKWLLVLLLLVLAVFLLRVGAAIPAGVVAILSFFAPLIQDFLRKKYINNEPAKKPEKLMSKEEAQEILGVTENSSKEEIKEAYLRLIKKNHPDSGGSEFIASQINQAKEILIGKD